MLEKRAMLGIGASVVVVVTIMANGGFFAAGSPSVRTASVGPAVTTTPGGAPGETPVPTTEAPTTTVTTTDGTTGGARARPALALSASQLSFGRVRTGRTDSQSVRVRNAGNATLTVDAVAVGGRNAGAFSLARGNDSFTVEPGANRTVSVRFAPTETGSVTAALNLTSDDPDLAHVTVWLSGRGTHPSTHSHGGNGGAGGHNHSGGSSSGSNGGSTNSSDSGTSGSSGNDNSGTSGSSDSGDSGTNGGTGGSGSAGSCSF